MNERKLLYAANTTFILNCHHFLPSNAFRKSSLDIGLFTPLLSTVGSVSAAATLTFLGTIANTALGTPKIFLLLSLPPSDFIKEASSPSFLRSRGLLIATEIILPSTLVLSVAKSAFVACASSWNST